MSWPQVVDNATDAATRVAVIVSIAWVIVTWLKN